MKDLDFDELDRAVNSLITSAPVATNTDIPEKTLEIEPGPTEQLLPAATPTPSTFTPSPLLARRSTGRFMDVVPPSVNTRVAVSAPERISRQGLTITPEPTAPVQSVETVVEPAAVTAESPAPVAPTNNWPDPIDFSGVDMSEGAEKVEIPTVEENEDADIDEINNEITNTMNQNMSESLDSPFISGTKVEKRPLGAFSDGVPAVTETPEPVVTPEPTETAVSTPEPLMTTPVSTIAPFPAELSEDLLSIESGGSTVTEPVVTAEPVVEVPVVPESTPIAPTITVAETPAPSTTTDSIAQQYTEQPSSGDQTTGAIYDTDAYHKALVTPSKKKAGWLWVVWMVVLLVVGAAAGAAVYYLVMPNL